MLQLHDSRKTYGSRISDRIWVDNNGQLVIRDAVIARTGSYDYLESQVINGGDENKMVQVYRTDDEVFDPISIASFENKPFTDDHPDDDVNLDNNGYLQKGFIRDVRRGTGELQNCLICDIVVTDKSTIDKIKDGVKRELSLGYKTNIIEKDGKFYMTKIRGNHLALVDSGRAGIATIRDSKVSKNIIGGQDMSKKRFLKDDDILEVEEIEELNPQDDNHFEEFEDEEITELEELHDDEEIETVESLRAKKDELRKEYFITCGKLKALEGEEIVEDEEPEVTEVEVEPVEPVVDEETEVPSKVVEPKGDEEGELLDADDLEENGDELAVKDAAVDTYSKFVKVTINDANDKEKLQKSIATSFAARFKQN